MQGLYSKVIDKLSRVEFYDVDIEEMPAIFVFDLVRRGISDEFFEKLVRWCSENYKYYPEDSLVRKIFALIVEVYIPAETSIPAYKKFSRLLREVYYSTDLRNTTYFQDNLKAMIWNLDDYSAAQIACEMLFQQDNDDFFFVNQIKRHPETAILNYHNYLPYEFVVEHCLKDPKLALFYANNYSYGPFDDLRKVAYLDANTRHLFDAIVPKVYKGMLI
jgi:hypothetical protein